MIVVDCEASGADLEIHGLLSIGALDFDHPENTFYGECRLRDGAAVDPEGLAVAGFTEEQIRDQTKMTEEELIKKFHEWCSSIPDKILAGQNTHFDQAYLRGVYKRAGIAWPFGYRLVDLHSIAYASFVQHKTPLPFRQGRMDIRLDTILPYVGLTSRGISHHAMDDVYLEAESFSRLLFGKCLLNRYRSFPVPKFLQSSKPL